MPTVQVILKSFLSDKGEIANAELVSFGVSSETVGRVGWGNSIWLKIIINKTKLVLK